MSYSRDLTHTGKDLKGCVFLEALAQREEANRCGKMTVSYMYMYYIIPFHPLSKSFPLHANLHFSLSLSIAIPYRLYYSFVIETQRVRRYQDTLIMLTD